MRATCQPKSDGTCSQCGAIVRDVRQCPRGTHPPLPRERQLGSLTPAIRHQPLQLGDYTESLLASLGVTQERYKAAKELFGLPPTCNCSGRIEWLNRVSSWWRGGG